MGYAAVDDERRIKTWISDSALDGLDDADRADVLRDFTEYFANDELIERTVSASTSDFVVENGEARFEPTGESAKAILDAESMESAPERMDSTDDALCELYEQSLAQSSIMDEQDDAICALYEMMEA